MTGAGARPSVHIVGAGLSGLAVAWALTERGRHVIVDEAAAGPGGLLQTTHTADGIVESAARAFLWSERVAALFAAASVQPVFADQRAKRRYIYRGGRPRRWPLGPAETLALVGRGASAFLTRRTAPRPGESVASWGRRVLGRAGTTWLLAPALQGIYASPLEMLSAEAIFGGGRVRGKLATAPAGLTDLLDRLVSALARRGATIRFASHVDALDPGQPTVVATSAPAAAALIGAHAPAVAEAIGRIRQTHVLSVTAFYPPNAADLRGFGVLFPRGAGLEALGVLFNTDMFPGRGEHRSETWIYGDASAERLDALRADIGTSVATDRARFTGRTDRPRSIHPTAWPQALPIYGPDVLAARARFADLPRWLTLAGNYVGKIGVSALVESADQIAHRVEASAD